MTKREAAVYLGVSYRAIERYTSNGKLSVSYEPGVRGGSRAIYQQSELDQLKETINQHHKDKQVINLLATSPHHDTNKTTQISNQTVDIAAIVGAVITQLLPAIRPAKQDDLYLLSLSEAAVATGLPVEYLIAASQKKKKRLKVICIGKDDLRIRRADLKKFINDL